MTEQSEEAQKMAAEIQVGVGSGNFGRWAIADRLESFAARKTAEAIAAQRCAACDGPYPNPDCGHLRNTQDMRERVPCASADGKRVIAAAFELGLEEAARVADNYGREAERTSKEYACEMADEMAARIRALISEAETTGGSRG